MPTPRRAVDISQEAVSDREALKRLMRPLHLSDGSQVPCARIGSGTPVICLPMVAETNFVYARQIQALACDHEFIVYEPRLSRTSRVAVADRAEEVQLVLDALEIDSAHVYAWSDTGSAAYHLAKSRPDRCRSLCLVGLADRYTFPAPVRYLANVAYRNPGERLIPPLLLNLLLGYYLSGERTPAGWVRREARAIPGFLRLFKHSVLPNLIEHRPVEGEIAVPTLALCGDRDRLLTVDQARRMAGLIGPHCDFKVVPGGEHFLPYATPEPVNSALRDFYASLDGMAGPGDMEGAEGAGGVDSAGGGRAALPDT
ncbi:alpha/beta hydrolase [Streptomyces sp. FXJ1.4098]|uniref:alpha/beta fold hydrolase n=1 Tax=Streptomyces sp. NPDC020845 TaxID=3365096 RepID=UPI0029995066|nr:alpha/beta hydrolase [Streptomyces sp. FXJ1.4098]